VCAFHNKSHKQDDPVACGYSVGWLPWLTLLSAAGSCSSLVLLLFSYSCRSCPCSCRCPYPCSCSCSCSCSFFPARQANLMPKEGTTVTVYGVGRPMIAEEERERGSCNFRLFSTARMLCDVTVCSLQFLKNKNKGRPSGSLLALSPCRTYSPCDKFSYLACKGIDISQLGRDEVCGPHRA
jgi:hypothetical protein